MNLFCNIFQNVREIESVIEFGPNIGLNLIAIKELLPEVKITAVEINKKACSQLKKLDWLTVINDSVLNFTPKNKYDFVFTSGVLIHINPKELSSVYEKLYESTNKYIMIAESYNPVPIEIKYRGYKNKLFKRDFAGELLLKYPGLKLLNYGFTYHLDNNFPQDDNNWFLLERTSKN